MRLRIRSGAACPIKVRYVEIFAQGPEEAVDGFISDIENKPPKRAAILKMNIEPVEEAEDFTEFAIIESEKTKGEIFVSPDIAICDECKEEMFDPKNRTISASIYQLYLLWTKTYDPGCPSV